MNERRMLVLFFAGIILLPWAVPFNLLFRGTPLILWKQVLALVLSFITIRWFFQIKHPAGSSGIRSLLSVYIWVIFFIIFIWFYISVSGGLSITRCAYAIISYIGFFPYIVLPIIAYKYGKLRELYKFIAIVSIMCSIGIIFDYIFNVSSFLFAYLGNSFEAASNTVSDGIYVRAKFPFESPSACYGFLSLGLLFNYLIFQDARTIRSRFISLVGFATIMIGGFLTYSRTNWLFLTLLFLSVLISESLKIFKAFRFQNFALLVFVALVIIFTGYFYAPKLKAFDIVLNRIENFGDITDVSNEHRFNRWSEALVLVTNLSSSTFFGNGLGATMGQIQDGFVTHTHYESSFFQAYYEGGIIGLFVRYFGYLIAFVGFIKGGSGNLRINKLLMVWFGCYFLATFASPTAGSYYGQMAFFISIGMTMIRPYFRLRLHKKRGDSISQADSAQKGRLEAPKIGTEEVK